MLLLIILIVVFLKNEWNSSLSFCDNNKNKNIINIFLKIIKQIRDKVFSFIDEFEDADDFIFANENFTIYRLIKDNSVIDNDNDEDDDNLLIINSKLMIICYRIKKIIFLFV